MPPSVSSLINDVEETIARSSHDRCADALRSLTALFVSDADVLSEDQIDLFDAVISRLAAVIETRARADLADQLADVPKAPPGVIRFLANDEIGVARPVLCRSQRLSEGDLVALAQAKGRDHLLAISERAMLSEPVTDALVARGDRLVAHALAGNPGARLSEMGFAALIDRARADAALQTLLGQRADLSDPQLRQLVDIAKATARTRLSEALPQVAPPSIHGAVERSATSVEAAIIPGGRAYGAALEAVQAIVAARPLEEGDVSGFAGAGETERTICAISQMVGLSLSAIERLFSEEEADLLLVIGKAQGWDWPTLRSLVGLRKGRPLAAHQLKRIRTAYDELSPAAAQRIVRVMREREASQKQAAQAAAERRQIRSKVK